MFWSYIQFGRDALPGTSIKNNGNIEFVIWSTFGWHPDEPLRFKSKESFNIIGKCGWNPIMVAGSVAQLLPCRGRRWTTTSESRRLPHALKQFVVRQRVILHFYVNCPKTKATSSSSPLSHLWVVEVLENRSGWPLNKFHVKFWSCWSNDRLAIGR